MTLPFFGNLIIALLMIVLLWYILRAFPFMAPYGKVIDIGCTILAVIVVISAFTGRPFVHIVGSFPMLS